MKKKHLLSVFALVLALAVFAAACGQKPAASPTDLPTEPSSEAPSEGPGTPAEPVTVHVAGLSGPTSMGMIQMIAGKALNDETYTVDYEIAAAPDVLTGKLINGEVEIAALPTNTAAVLYNKTEGEVQLLAQNTLGVLYLVGKDAANITTAADLAGKSLVMSGSGGVPEFALNYILDHAGVKDGATVDYLPDHAAAAQALLGGDAELAVLPQPFVTQVLAKNTDLKILLDLNAAWEEAAQGESLLVMGCLVVRRDFAEANPEFVERFLAEYEKSVAFVNENPAEASLLIAEAGIVPDAGLAEKAIPFCNIVFKTGAEAKAGVEGFLKVLFGANPAAVGGKLPGADFYYGA